MRYMAQLTNPTPVSDGTNRFIWLDECDAVAVLRYNHKGDYVGTDRITKNVARLLWIHLLAKGWTCTIRKGILDYQALRTHWKLP